MNIRPLYSLMLLVLAVPLAAKSQAPHLDDSSKTYADSSPDPQSMKQLPTETILVEGARSSASDSVTPVPEGAKVTQNVFSAPYFGITYTLPSDWIQEYEGPPPSENARYVLAQVGPKTGNESASASMLITAQDMFFTPVRVSSAFQLAEYAKDHLQAEYKVETPPVLVTMAGRSFSFFAYWSPIAGLHWYVFTVQIRCHALQFVLTSRDPKLLDRLVLDLNKMKLRTDADSATEEGKGSIPVCIADYAREENLIARLDPIFTDHRFNPVPVRIVIDKQGKIKHIHVISAFADQAKAIADSLPQWRFKPYFIDGKPTEVETGILFGLAPHPAPRAKEPTVQ